MPKRLVKWWWKLPRWLKLSKLAIVLVIIFSFPAMDAYRQWEYYHAIYDTYYAHFYAAYDKTHPAYQARHYAEYYADFYASYYSSPAYQKHQRYALPSATKQTTAYPQSSAVAGLTLTPQGLTMLKQFEGLRLEPYKDVGGKLTIGYGHLIKPGEYYDNISKEDAHTLLLEDVKVAEAIVKRYVKVKLTPQQFSALTSLVYNIGPDHFRRSTLLMALNKGDTSRAAEEFLRWDHVGTTKVRGLTRRRKAEKELFES
ncbi:MAG: lysozyme [Rickettsiales bacterium]